MTKFKIIPLSFLINEMTELEASVLSRVEQFENDTFFVLVWTENFLYPQLFKYAAVILSCNLSSQVINMAKNMVF